MPWGVNLGQMIIFFRCVVEPQDIPQISYLLPGYLFQVWASFYNNPKKKSDFLIFSLNPTVQCNAVDWLASTCWKIQVAFQRKDVGSTIDQDIQQAILCDTHFDLNQNPYIAALYMLVQLKVAVHTQHSIFIYLIEAVYSTWTKPAITSVCRKPMKYLNAFPVIVIIL